MRIWVRKLIKDTKIIQKSNETLFIIVTFAFKHTHMMLRYTRVACMYWMHKPKSKQQFKHTTNVYGQRKSIVHITFINVDIALTSLVIGLTGGYSKKKYKKKLDINMSSKKSTSFFTLWRRKHVRVRDFLVNLLEFFWTCLLLVLTFLVFLRLTYLRKIVKCGSVKWK